ncbi:group II intron reverse transcriptase/maturase [Nonomuraea typhae]|uniref:Group II intron reverse transcriptase/maturase n=1 Tax=Nonomuraea typhae TaxID=2603600 RepID=A0ABW7ZCE7_9ACTN
MNGPEDGSFGWDSVHWGRAEQQVKRLRQRIFAATQAGDLAKVRNLQKLMLRSRSNALVSVRRVAEINAGRRTAGIDGKVALLAQEKADLAAWVHGGAAAWSPRPVRRVYVPKSNGRRRPLGIPVIADRALQALVVNALEPEWEARFEPRSYGFRPGRGCHDAIEAIYKSASGKLAKRLWVLDADLEAAFDRLSHDHILASLGTFPARGMVSRWLKAGVMKGGRIAPTPQGAPQGGVISPLLMNVALHGMEKAAGVEYKQGGDALRVRAGSPTLVRYADDLLALCHSREQAEQVKTRLAVWLELRGLAFSEAKTQIAHLNDGVDFLGFEIRRHRGKVLTKPSRDALQRIRRRLTHEVKALRGANADMLISKLNPIIRGWATYYRIGVSKRAFNALDAHVWGLVYKWAKFSHPNKSKHWITTRYFGRFNQARGDKWVFGSRETGFHLRKFSWTTIVRHRLVSGWASPDDPSLASYWADRRNRSSLWLDSATRRLLYRQQGRCPLCQGLLLYADHEPQTPREWEQWLTATRTTIRKNAITTSMEPGTPDDPTPHHLIHRNCRTQINAAGAHRF